MVSWHRRHFMKRKYLFGLNGRWRSGDRENVDQDLDDDLQPGPVLGNLFLYCLEQKSQKWCYQHLSCRVVAYFWEFIVGDTQVQSFSQIMGASHKEKSLTTIKCVHFGNNCKEKRDHGQLLTIPRWIYYACAYACLLQSTTKECYMLDYGGDLTENDWVFLAAVMDVA